MDAKKQEAKPTVKVKFTVDHEHDGKAYKAGDTALVTETGAKKLVAGKFAETAVK